MAFSGVAKRGEAVCVCSGTTVFKGAVIGQVFTGEVHMQCPHYELDRHGGCSRFQLRKERRKSKRATLIVLGIMHAIRPWLPPDIDSVVSGLSVALCYWVYVGSGRRSDREVLRSRLQFKAQAGDGL